MLKMEDTWYATVQEQPLNLRIVKMPLLNRVHRQASDAILSMPHAPGDDNYNNPMTNVDFHVTPPVRSMSVSEVMDPQDTRNQGYFRSDISGNYSPSTPVIPEQNAYESPTNDIDVPNTDHVSTPTERTVKVDSTTFHPTAASPNLKSGLRDVKHKPSSDKDRTTSTDSHYATLQREKSFGTNLTTGKREYISHYQRVNTDNGESIELQEVGHSSATAAAGSHDSASDMNRRSDSDSMRETDTSTDYARDSETSTDVDIY